MHSINISVPAGVWNFTIGQFLGKNEPYDRHGKSVQGHHFNVNTNVNLNTESNPYSVIRFFTSACHS